MTRNAPLRPRDIGLRSLAAACAVLAACALGATPAAAQGSLVGKTLSGTVRICTGGGRTCAPPTKLQAYISSAGRIFDYSSSEAGVVAPLGQWVVNGAKRSRYTLKGNVLTAEAIEGNVEIRGVVRARGRSCDARYEARVIGSSEQVTVETLSCEVRDGNQPF